ncbi:hypothetical protein NQ315_007407 [Exocentrus adspersus]|uniref:RING-type domain-containing protein n=1 Tax=Exocentrus adspersus TaxID=1586481 RepID=A0AAV8VHY4_9CUCU|nr:hypothetical protein NQ315_007407 [Exocentrus adspersus]
MQGSKKIPIIDLNQHLTCKICNGYFIDATTIVECLHTFCRSCIVRYLESNKYCPVCDVQVHKTKPLLNIRPDKTIQDIVYKLVPRLFHNETQRRREYYESHAEAKPSALETCNEAAYQYLLTPEESIYLTLSYHGSNATPRYLRCPAAVSVNHLKKLIRAKYDLTEDHRVEILYNQDCLNPSLTLIDIAYIYLWKRKGPMELTYRIYECCATKKLKLEQDQMESSRANATTNNNNWKEVQLRISESGEMSITGIQDAALSPSLLEIVNSDQQKYKNEAVSVTEASKTASATTKKELPGLKFIGKGGASTETINSDVKSEPGPACSSQQDVSRLETSTAVEVTVTAPSFLSSCATLSSGTTTMVFSTINSSKCSTKTDEVVVKKEPIKTEAMEDKMENGNSSVEPKTEVTKNDPPKAVANNVAAEISLKRKSDGGTEAEPPPKQPKQTILNHSIGLLNLSNNHPLKKHKLNRNGENVKEFVLRASAPNCEPTLVPAEFTTTKPPMTAPKSVAATTDTASPKPNIINKLLSPIAHSGRPGTPITSKPSPTIPTSKPQVGVYTKSPCYMPKTAYNPVISVPKPVTSCSMVKGDNKPPSSKNDAKVSASPPKPATSTAIPKIEVKAGAAASSQQPQQQILNLNSKMGIKSKPSTPIGYKTLRDPPKSWNSQISKANLNKQPTDPKYSELKNIRPAKFFKMRNNMPRYLGNPASGVKPMYQVHVSPEKDKQQDALPNKSEKSEIRKHSIVKIDPKTLKPISEKAPETTSLSNHSSTSNQILNHSLGAQTYQSLNSAGQCVSGPSQGDLKINTSSVSIFNPLKLQSSPKNERKSPKSPHSPKMKAQPGNSQASGKRDKVNLNFTPPNPFVPNLASPTMSPNQFLYPTGPPGFPPYDPRMMAAYHSLWYGQRMGFPASPIPPRLSLDLNQQRKNFDMIPSPTSPKTAPGNHQNHSPQPVSTKTTSTTSSSVSVSKAQNHLQSPKPAAPSKKAPKDSKSDKSLETTVEKLTLNRNKEMSGGKSELPNPAPVAPKAENVEKEEVKSVEVKEEVVTAVEKPVEAKVKETSEQPAEAEKNGVEQTEDKGSEEGVKDKVESEKDVVPVCATDEDVQKKSVRMEEKEEAVPVTESGVSDDVDNRAG